MIIEPLPFYAVVTVGGKRGVVFGRVEHRGSYNYSVEIEGEDQATYMPHDQLVPTGVVMRRGDFYDGRSITVVVDEQGRGITK